MDVVQRGEIKSFYFITGWTRRRWRRVTKKPRLPEGHLLGRMQLRLALLSRKANLELGPPARVVICNKCGNFTHIY